MADSQRLFKIAMERASRQVGPAGAYFSDCTRRALVAYEVLVILAAQDPSVPDSEVRSLLDSFFDRLNDTFPGA